jgi:hypothetical protein
MTASPTPTVLVSPTALVLSMLHTGGGTQLPVIIARSQVDFMRRALHQPPTVAVMGRGWLSELQLRRLALRRAFSSAPRLLLVLGRDEAPTDEERQFFDAVIVAGQVFLRSARRLQHLVDAPATLAAGASTAAISSSRPGLAPDYFSAPASALMSVPSSPSRDQIMAPRSPFAFM